MESTRYATYATKTLYILYYIYTKKQYLRRGGMYTSIYMSRYTSSFSVFVFALAVPFAVSAASVSLSAPSPSATIMVANNLTLNVVPSGISYPIYGLQDSFSNSSASASNIEPGGRFSWTPSRSDVGTHVLTFTATGSEGTVSASQTITVLPPPSMAIGPLSPGDTVLPGSTLSFVVTTTGFTNPTFTAGGFPANPAVTTNGIDSSGRFSWTPQLSDKGEYTITVYVSDSLGHNASKSVSVRVGKGPSLSIVLLSPGAQVSPGQMLSFTAAPNDFSPTGFSVRDSVANSSISNSQINLSGQFAWVPSQGDVGTHVLTITGVVGAYGASASTTQTITVLGPGGVVPSVATTTSSDTLAALQAKLALLQGTIATQSTTASTPSAGASTFTSYLRPGATGDEVKRLQEVLVQLGYLSATPNGTYGPATAKAVSKFQSARGLDPLGVVGPATRTALNALGGVATAAPTTTSVQNTFVFEHFMGVGDDDPDVLHLQVRLAALGFFAGETTGYYGAGTEAAVKKFQAARGLPVTGYCARDTRAALNR